MFDLLLILSGNFLSLPIHSGNIGFIALAQLIHSFDEIISLLGQLSELIVHQNFLLTSPNLLISE